MRWRYGLGMAAIWLLCAVAAVVGLVWLAAAILAATLTGRPSGRAWRLAVSFDQVGNAATAGDEDETISARCWRLRHLKRYALLVRLIDGVAATFSDPNHCRDAYEAEMAKRCI